MTTEKAPVTLATREEAVELLDGEFGRLIAELQPEILLMTEDQLELARQPNENDYLLRQNFWKQVEICRKAGGTHIAMASIYRGVCSKQAFQGLIVQPIRLAWLLFHPQENKERAKGILSLGMSRLARAIMTMPINDKTFNSYIKALEMLWNRAEGPVVQQLHALHAHRNLNKPLAPAAPTADTNARIEALKEKLESAKDVTPLEVKAT